MIQPVEKIVALLLWQSGKGAAGHRRPDSPNCYNCGVRLEGPFCAACGQKALPLDVTFSEFLHELTHEILHIDGKIFASVRNLFFAPGFLSREQFEGRRARWVSPIRLYLIFSVVYFAITALLSAAPFQITIRNTGGAGDQDLAEFVRRAGFENEQQMREAVDRTLIVWLPRVMFLLVPLFAWLVKLTYRRAKLTYLQHLYFALHLHAAWFGAATLAKLADRALPAPFETVIGAALIACGLIYFVIALRRAYSVTTAGALKRSAVVLPVYGVAVTIAVLAITLPVVFGRFWHLW